MSEFRTATEAVEFYKAEVERLRGLNENGTNTILGLTEEVERLRATLESAPQPTGLWASYAEWYHEARQALEGSRPDYSDGTHYNGSSDET